MPDQEHIEVLLEERMSPLEAEIRQLTAELRAVPEEEQELAKTIKLRLRTLQREAHQAYIDFGFEHSYGATGLGILYNNRHRIERHKLQQLVNELKPEVRKIRVARSLRIFLEEKLVEVGLGFHDFEAEELSGKYFKLSTLLGRPILLTFWGGGCRWARMRNQWLREHYDVLCTRVQILSFYLGTDREQWERLSMEDQIHWCNVSDLEGGHGTVKTRYDFQGVPTSVLIGADGRVLARERENGFGHDLIHSITKLLES